MTQIAARTCLLVSLLALATFAPIQGAHAARALPYGDGSAFEKAQATPSSLLLLDFHSNHCSTCVKQAAVLKKLLDEPKFKGIQWYQVQYEGTSPMSQKYEVDHSSLIVFRGNVEIGRGIGHMDTKSLSELLTKSLNKKSN